MFSYLVRITSKGQITITQQGRRELGLEPGDEVDVVVQDGVARIVPAGEPRTRGNAWRRRCWARGDVELSTDEIMAMTRGD